MFGSGDWFRQQCLHFAGWVRANLGELITKKSEKKIYQDTVALFKSPPGLMKNTAAIAIMFIRIRCWEYSTVTSLCPPPPTYMKDI